MTLAAAAAVAEVLGMDKTTMSKIEHGRRRLDGFDLALVAERLESGAARTGMAICRAAALGA